MSANSTRMRRALRVLTAAGLVLVAMATSQATFGRAFYDDGSGKATITRAVAVHPQDGVSDEDAPEGDIGEPEFASLLDSVAFGVVK